MNKNNSLKVFLCHAKEDKPKVRDFYHRLISDGYDAWLDEEKLTPGQDWDFEIQKAVREADIVVVFVSTDSVAKTGYVQKEINFALDAAEMRPEGLIYIIPSRLNECQIPTRLSKWQWVNLYEKNGYLKLRLSLKSQAKILGKIIEPSLDVFEPEMIKIPSGPFLMGSTPEQIQKALQDGALSDWVKNNDEQPQHIVEMPDYFIAKYPVTNKEYQVFIRDIKHHPPTSFIGSKSKWIGDDYPDGRGDYPVTNVSREDSLAYCEWLKLKTGKPFRLPTEAEWEKAARGTDGRIWPWGDNFDPKYANTKEAKIMDSTRVGQFSPMGDSPYKCVDMVGNIWEWCSDWYREEEYAERVKSGVIIKNPQGPASGITHTIRGGSFGTGRAGNRCADRMGYIKHLLQDKLGFRIALSII